MMLDETKQMILLQDYDEMSSLYISMIVIIVGLMNLLNTCDQPLGV